MNLHANVGYGDRCMDYGVFLAQIKSIQNKYLNHIEYTYKNESTREHEASKKIFGDFFYQNKE